MRGIDLAIFDFDYDLTWMALFLNADGQAYGRYGGRTPDSQSVLYSLKGLRHALTAALAMHRAKGAPPRATRQPGKVEEYPAAQRLPDQACIHCHHVYDFHRDKLQAAGAWTIDEVWVYPEPGNIGLTMNRDRGNEVDSVANDSPARHAGIAKGDLLKSVNGQPIASIADLQYALHRGPASGNIPLVWERGDQVLRGNLKLAPGWRKTDVSWRWSLRGLAPPSQVHGDDLTHDEKKTLGLGPAALAFRQGNFVPPTARQAGIQINDVILAVDGKALDLTARQFDAFVGLNYKIGALATYNILRGKERLDIPLKLIDR